MADAPRLSASQVTTGALTAATMAFTGMYLGSYLGELGTAGGAVVGSVLSTTVTWVWSRLAWHTKAGVTRVSWRPSRSWTLAGGGIAAGAGLTIAAVTGIGLANATHVPLHAAVTGRSSPAPAGVTVAPAAPSTAILGPSVTGSAATVPASATVSATPSPTLTPSVIPSPVPDDGPSAVISAVAPSQPAATTGVTP